MSPFLTVAWVQRSYSHKDWAVWRATDLRCTTRHSWADAVKDGSDYTLWNMEHVSQSENKDEHNIVIIWCMKGSFTTNNVWTLNLKASGSFSFGTGN